MRFSSGSRGGADDAREYVSELSSRLRVGARRRRRIVAETADHFAEAVAGELERSAELARSSRNGEARLPLLRAEAIERVTERFGDPAALADEFNRDDALHGLRRSSAALVACAVPAFLSAGAVNQWGPAHPWPSDRAFYLVTQLLLQVAVVCALNGLFLAVIAPWVRGVPLSGRPAILAGRSLAIAAVTLAIIAAVSAGNVAGTSSFPARLLLTIVAVTVPGVAVWSLRSAARAPMLSSDESSDLDNTVDVIVATASALAGRWQPADRAYQASAALWRRFPRLTRWLDLRTHPWRTAATTSASAGFLLKAPDLLKGDLDYLAAGIEAAAVFTCFALLGGVLGLRARTSAAHSPTSDRADGTGSRVSHIRPALRQ